MDDQSIDELKVRLAELERSGDPEDAGEGYTTRELAERWEMSDKCALKLVRAGLDSGKLKLGRKVITTIIGVRRPAACWVPVSQ